MRLEILLRGITGEPLVLDATMFIVRHDDSTPVCVGGEYGPERTIRCSHALDKDFNATLRALGVQQMVICDELVLPAPPPGAKLVRAPSFR
jgi:hypothetical protein